MALFKKRFEKLLVLIEEFETLSDSLRNEYLCGTYTGKLSRADLADIARTMLPRSRWGSDGFTTPKDRLVQKYRLSNKKFSKALDIIQKNYHFSSYLGVEIPIAGLPVVSLDRIDPIAWGKISRQEMEIDSMIALNAAFQMAMPTQYSKNFSMLAADSAKDPDVLSRAAYLFSKWNKKIDRLRIGLLKLGQVSLADHQYGRSGPP